METIKFTMRSASPLLMHNATTVDPLHPISAKMREFTSKRKKTEDDQASIADLR
jgi:hypothetical protein